MIFSHTLFRTLVIILALACAQGCGQKGDLFLPDEEAALHNSRFG